MSNPAFSPDGTTMAFSAKYNGNTDVFVVPVEGGPPTRLTWHPGPDLVQGFTPDGKQVLFTSPRAVFTGRYTQLFTVPVEAGGVEDAAAAAPRGRAAYSRDGQPDRLQPARAGLPPVEALSRRHRSRRSGIYDVQSHAVREDPAAGVAGQRRRSDVGGRHAVLPIGSGRRVQPLFVRHERVEAVRQLTRHADFPVLSVAAGGGQIVYEQAGYLHLLDPASRQVAPAHDRRARRICARRARAS